MEIRFVKREEVVRFMQCVHGVYEPTEKKNSLLFVHTKIILASPRSLSSCPETKW